MSKLHTKLHTKNKKNPETVVASGFYVVGSIGLERDFYRFI